MNIIWFITQFEIHLLIFIVFKFMKHAKQIVKNRDFIFIYIFLYT